MKICDECETVAHCTKHGCIPKVSSKDLAMRLALEALEESLGYVEEEAENAQRLYGQYPTRQERIQGLKDDVRKHMKAITALREALAEQPAQRTWVGLTDKERNIINRHNVYVSDIISATEAKLREKNT